MKKKLTIFLFVFVSMAISCFAENQRYEEFLAQGKEYENQEKYVYALGSYYDAMLELDNLLENEAQTRSADLAKIIKSGKPGKKEYYNDFELHDGWKAILKEFEQYWKEHNFLAWYNSECSGYIDSISLFNINYETRESEWLSFLALSPSDKFIQIWIIFYQGYLAAKKDFNWEDLEELYEPIKHLNVYDIFMVKHFVEPYSDKNKSYIADFNVNVKMQLVDNQGNVFYEKETATFNGNNAFSDKIPNSKHYCDKDFCELLGYKFYSNVGQDDIDEPYYWSWEFCHYFKISETELYEKLKNKELHFIIPEITINSKKYKFGKENLHSFRLYGFGTDSYLKKIFVNNDNDRFYILLTPVTNGLWNSIMKPDSIVDKYSTMYLPKSFMYYYNAKEDKYLFMNKLSEKYGYVPVYEKKDEKWIKNENANGFRFPLESELSAANIKNPNKDFYIIKSIDLEKDNKAENNNTVE